MRFDFKLVRIEEGVFESTTTDILANLKSKITNFGEIYPLRSRPAIRNRRKISCSVLSLFINTKVFLSANE